MFNETHGANGFPLLIKQLTWFTDRDHTKYFLRTSVFQWFFKIVPSNCFSINVPGLFSEWMMYGPSQVAESLPWIRHF